MGEVDPETRPVVSTLVKIAETGQMFTINGQPGICDKGQRQRAFSEAFIRADALPRFLARLPPDIAVFGFIFHTSELFYFHATVAEKDWSVNMRRGPVISLTTEYPGGRHYTNFPPQVTEKVAKDTLGQLPNAIAWARLGGRYGFEDSAVWLEMITHKKCKYGISKRILNALT
uniref:DUF6919 domain-containing protein n=1 Tax=Marseillevirus LCMAC103 TaxID=2506604 RepID=A0A481YW09_9VIRU|nr:MAG: hypothetical protein LCMAC103_03170 [Marseillevirus LCMAC103]